MAVEEDAGGWKVMLAVGNVSNQGGWKCSLDENFSHKCHLNQLRLSSAAYACQISGASGSHTVTKAAYACHTVSKTFPY